MKKVCDTLPAPRTAVVTGSDAGILGEIAGDGIDLALWQRSLEPELVREIAALDLDAADNLLLTCDVADAAARLRDVLPDSGYPECPLLRTDIAALAARHALLLGDLRVRIRLEVVETDACRKFHADFVTARTITTYRGRGTQWKRSAETDDQPVEELRPGTVGLFKGRLFGNPPLQHQPSILHRSPPIADSGESRLVLVIDSVEGG